MASLVDHVVAAGCSIFDATDVVDAMADALEREAARLAIIERNEDTLAFLKVAKWMRANK